MPDLEDILTTLEKDVADLKASRRGSFEIASVTDVFGFQDIERALQVQLGLIRATDEVVRQVTSRLSISANINPIIRNGLVPVDVTLRFGVTEQISRNVAAITRQVPRANVIDFALDNPVIKALDSVRHIGTISNLISIATVVTSGLQGVPRRALTLDRNFPNARLGLCICFTAGRFLQDVPVLQPQWQIRRARQGLTEAGIPWAPFGQGRLPVYYRCMEL